MVWLSLRLGRGATRWLVAGIALYFTLFSPRSRAASRAYLHQVGAATGWRATFRHFFAFASTIHDRIYLLNGRFDLFNIEVHGTEALHATLSSQPGLLLMGGHLGSFEVLRSVGRGHAQLPVAMLMYADNARKINTILETINPSASADIIPLGQIRSMLEARDRLEQGTLVGMLADRGLGGDSTRITDFLGRPAAFPLGPWRVAAMLRRPVFFMTGLYLGGNRYRIHLEPLADFSAVERGERENAIAAAVDRYADRLAHFCRIAPNNWFNFFDFWQS
ncbi:MAG: acyl-CoA synthetase [Zoogloeaceae bacterium]|nr:acyl-CoA synthetase [Zoogloeaceae bacterium]